MVYCYADISSSMFVFNNYRHNVVNSVNYDIDNITVRICSNIHDNDMRVIGTIIIHF